MSNNKNTHLIWLEISKKALSHNIKTIRNLIKSKILAPAVKSNAYGHGIIETSKIVLEAGADWLCVNALFEAEMLRKAGIKAPIYIMGYVMKKDLIDAVRLNCRLIVYNKEIVRELAKAAIALNKKASVHIKLETGTHRQGISTIAAVIDFAHYIESFKSLRLEGISTHFANIEDTTNYQYAQEQLHKFTSTLAQLEQENIHIPLKHCANTAATMLFPETHFDMVRPGISVYGLWPSKKTKTILEKRKAHIQLMPVLSWRTRIAQIKKVEKGKYVGYGCTYQTKRKTRLAVLPVGYYDGYDRSLSNKSYVLIHGKKAAVRGRVFMNMIVVDVTDIPEAKLEDPVTLLGSEDNNEISADTLAELASTINYEITTRIREGIPRIIV